MSDLYSPISAKKSREANLKHHFGVDHQQYGVLAELQDFRCGICQRPPKKRALAVDHDHKSLKIRGLLCWRCNTALQAFGDNPHVLRAAAKYLEDNPAKEYGFIAPKNRKRKPKKISEKGGMLPKGDE